RLRTRVPVVGAVERTRRQAAPLRIPRVSRERRRRGGAACPDAAPSPPQNHQIKLMNDRACFIVCATWGNRCCPSPAPLPSPSGRGRTFLQLRRWSRSFQFADSQARVLPLPEGEGRGEGESATQICSQVRKRRMVLKKVGGALD